MNVAAEALSRSKIRKLVREFRKAIGCEKMEYFPIVQFIEWILANPESGMDLKLWIQEKCRIHMEPLILRKMSCVYEAMYMKEP